MTRRVLVFLALTFALDWGFIAVYLGLGGTMAMPWGILVGVLYMFGPAVAAVLTQRLVAREGVVGPLGIRFRPNRWFLVAWLGPAALALAAIGVGVLLPDVAYAPDMEGLYARFEAMMPAEDIAAMRRQAEDFPVDVFWIMLAQGLLFGPTVNAVAAFGEELGWRGFLQRELAPFGFWRASLLVGVIWGVWHAPLILQGHNYPDHPVLGVVMMCVFTTLLSPLFAWVTLRGRSVIAAAIAHGSLNATAGLAVSVLVGGSDLLLGMTGLAGFVVLGAANLGLFLGARQLRAS